MSKEHVLINKLLVFIISLLPLISCNKSVINQKSKLLNKVLENCNSLKIDKKEYKYWSFLFYDNMLPTLIRTSEHREEYLKLYIKNDSSISGYYTLKTDTNFLEKKINVCDTTIHYKIIKKGANIDTVFHIGYYKYLYDNLLLSSGQKIYFSKYRDSLTNIRGSHLKELDSLPPEEPTEEDMSNDFLPIDE